MNKGAEIVSESCVIDGDKWETGVDEHGDGFIRIHRTRRRTTEQDMLRKAKLIQALTRELPENLSASKRIETEKILRQLKRDFRTEMVLEYEMQIDGSTYEYVWPCGFGVRIYADWKNRGAVNIDFFQAACSPLR